jgi:hypothetical protein
MERILFYGWGIYIKPHRARRVFLYCGSPTAMARDPVRYFAISEMEIEKLSDDSDNSRKTDYCPLSEMEAG